MIKINTGQMTAQCTQPVLYDLKIVEFTTLPCNKYTCSCSKLLQMEQNGGIVIPNLTFQCLVSCFLVLLQWQVLADHLIRTG